MEKLELNIQLFADEEENVVPTDTVENESEESETEVDFEDGASEEEESEEEETEDKEETKPQKTKEEKERDRKNFQRRIQEKQRKQEEEHKKQLEIEKHKAYVEGIKASTGGTNKFTQKPLVDDEDVEEYTLMLKLEREGKDPIEDYHEAVKEQRRAERQKAQAEAKAKEEADIKMNNEINAFVEKYGADTANALAKDKGFQEFSEGLIGVKDLSWIYEKYLAFQSKIEVKSDEKAMLKDARRKSSSGALGNKNETPSSFADMTPEEFHKFSLEIASRH